MVPRRREVASTGYPLVNVDREAGTLDIDFALHDGLATTPAKILREDYQIPRTSIKAQAYWVG